MPMPTKAGVFGIARIMRWWPPNQSDSDWINTPAAILIIRVFASQGWHNLPKFSIIGRICWGLTAKTMTSQIGMAWSGASVIIWKLD